MRLILFGVLLAGLQFSHQTEYPGAATQGGINRWYSGHGGFSTSGPGNCPITECDPTVCPFGKYLAGCGGTSRGDCNSGCDAIPSNSVYSSNGGFSASGCQWVCDVNYELNPAGTGCVLKTCAANGKESKPNSAFLAGAEGAYPNCKYRCNAGYIGVGTVSDGRGPNSCSICQVGTFAAAGAVSCTDCGPGFFSSSSGSSACSVCEASQLKYSIGDRNTVCSDCASCTLSGTFKKNCGGSLAGSCDPCTNTQYFST
jgi:hypothetical protein